MSTRSRWFRTSVALAAAATVAVATVPSASAAVAGHRPVTANKSEAAAGWLTQQLAGGNHLVGSFGGTKFVDYGGTADTIFALAAAHVGRASISHAIGYLRAHVESYVDIKNSDGFGPNDGAIAKTALAAMVAHAGPRSFGGYNLLHQLNKDECTSASTACPAPGAARNIFSSVSESLVILAESRAETLNPWYTPSAAATAYFLSLQCANGGFTVDTAGGAGCTSDPDATGYALQALRALGGRPAVMRKAAAWLFATRNRDGSWSAQGGHNTDSTALAIAGLHAAGHPATKSMNWLRRQQVTTGPTVGKDARRGALRYFGKFDPASSVKATADGVVGLRYRTLAKISIADAGRNAPVLRLARGHMQHRSVASGATDQVRATGFAAKERVDAMIHGGRVGRAVSNANGTVWVRFTVGPRRHAGKHVVVLTGHRSGLRTHATFWIRK